MNAPLLRVPAWIHLSLSLLAACGTARRPEPPLAQGPAVQAPAPPPHGLYAVDEALRDALSGPLEYVGTGNWPGIRRMYACAFRNARVLVVSAYCSPSEKQAFRLDIYSPTRGRVRIYAEAKGSFGTLRRADYFTFMVESEPPATEPLTLSMSFAALSAYDERRYDAFLPVCYGGQELSQPRGGCVGALAPQHGAWEAQNRSFIAHANEDWYRALQQFRALHTRYGKEPA